ncbi:formate/nitrite transporter family protein [Mollicutes bacterium LVI A0039]|nr:formate/nitrite transporter family protein [Mollicutes bacterium LVI A0039]
MERVFLGSKFIQETLNSAQIKNEMSSRFIAGYLMRAAMAGAFALFGYIMIMAFDANFNDSLNSLGLVFGASFFSLCLVAIYYTRSELLTSNMMILSVASYFKEVKPARMFKILLICFAGNITGAIIISLLVANSTIITAPMLESLEHSLTVKQGYIATSSYVDLFIRAIFCNFFINVAMLMVYSGNIKSDSAKIVAMFFGVFAFAYLGLEHSVANTALFTLAAMLELFQGIDVGFEFVQALSNIGIVIIGNFIGGGLLIGYYYAYMNDNRNKIKDMK